MESAPSLVLLQNDDFKDSGAAKMVCFAHLGGRGGGLQALEHDGAPVQLVLKLGPAAITGHRVDGGAGAAGRGQLLVTWKLSEI